MKKSTIIKPIVLVIAFLIVIAITVAITTCKDHNFRLPDTPDGDTRLVVAMHDAVQQARGVGNGKDIQGIEALYLTVRQMVIIGKGGQTVILDEERTFDILNVSISDSVIMSDVSIEPGVYQELRLVLKEENTVVINGETHPIKVPSGEQSGLKLKGPFNIPPGKLFTLMIELDAARSVSWNQGQGYRLHPVLNVSNGPDVLGIFRGNLTVVDALGANETLLQLYSDNTARLRIDEYPTYTLYADYNYNSITKTVKLTNLELDAPGLGRRALKRVMKKIPDEIPLPIKQWSLDSIIAVNSSGIKANLYRVDEFDFSEGVTFTEITINIDYPDGSKSGKDVITEIRFIDTGMPPVIYEGKLEGSRRTEIVPIKNNKIQGSNTRIQVVSYLFENKEDYDTEVGRYAGMPTLLMTGSTFSESTENPWTKPDTFKVVKDLPNQEFTIAFPPRLNIKMHHDNFTNNKPLITWDSYPGASNGYYVFVLVKDKDGTAYDNGNGYFAIAYDAFTTETQVQMYSNRVTFTPTYTSLDEISPSITKGDFIVIEVYVLDGSNLLNMRAKKGAKLMDSTIIYR